MFGFVSLFSHKFWCPDASWVSGSLNLYLMLLLLSREFFIFQIADVHLLHSATWWRLLGQKYSLTTEVTRLRLRGERVTVWCGNEIEPHYGRVAQTTGSQTKRERSPFAARSSRKIGPKCCTLVRFRAAATGDRSRSGTWATRPYLGCYNFNEQWRGLRKQIPAFASRFHFFASIILSAAESSSKVGAFHRRTAPSLALAR